MITSVSQPANKRLERKNEGKLKRVFPLTKKILRLLFITTLNIGK
jgi:hypothetical protein